MGRSFQLVFWIAVVSILYSCDRECCTNIDLSVALSVRSSLGEDLLDPDTPGSYNTSDVSIWYLKNGQLIDEYDEWSDSPRGYRILKYDSVYILSTSPRYFDDTENEITNFLRWNDIDTDTIRYEITRGNNFTRLSRVWYNNALVMDQDGIGVEQVITTVK